MPQRRILFLDSTRISAYRVSGTIVEAEGSFPPEAEGQSAFASYLRQHPRSLFMLLVDVPEEGFQIEDIPHSSGKDREAIIKRKLGQYFYGTQFSLAFSEGRLREGRRDERLLLMALTRAQHLEPWLEVIRQSHSILAGIYSVPQLVGALIPRDIKGGVLEITQTLGGLRQTFFLGGQLRFSRLSPLATGTAQEAALAAAKETGKMHQYLASQRLIERNRPLMTRVLVHPAQVSAMRESCQDSDALRFEFVDLLQEAQHLGLRMPLTDSRADALFCYLLAHKTPRVQFAPASERQFHRLWQTRFFLKSTAAAVLAAGLLVAAKQGIDILQMQDAIDQVRQQTQLDQQRYDATLRGLPQIPVTTDNLRAFVDRYDQVAKRAEGPQPLLTTLSHSLDAFPGIHLDSLDWKITDRLDVAPPAPGASPNPLPSGGIGPYAQAIVAAQLPLSLVGNQRGQLMLVADFVKHLQGNPGIAVEVLLQPVDTQSEKTLKSSDETGRQEAPRFSFRIARKL